MTATLEAMLASALPPDTLLEHLAPWSEHIEEDVIIMRSDASQWMLDLEHNRFQHLDATADARLHAVHGAWTKFRELAFYPAEALLVIEPENESPLRTHIHQLYAAEPTTQQDMPPPASRVRHPKP